MTSLIRLSVLSLFLFAGCANPYGPITASNDLFEKQWVLIEMDGNAVTQTGTKQDPHIEFTKNDGRITGFTGCKPFTGSFTRDGMDLRLMNIITTGDTCPQSKVEADYMKALSQVNRYTILKDELFLNYGRVVLARFRGAEKPKENLPK